MKTSIKSLVRALRIVAPMLVLLALVSPARGEEVDVRKIGVGYKVGNGIGFVGGDIVLRGLPHVAFDLQANYASASGLSGYGLAPTVQLQLKTAGHTPYVAVGAVYVSMSGAEGGGWVAGLVANAGYEWRFASGLGVMLGAGVGDFGHVHMTSGAGLSEGEPIGAHLNVEAGVRYFF